ncbi:LacI family DNA-binding transcriptional regulator [Schaalia suimastitidis]|uniref:LacI family DNA-binding transcriptional regulator n=1 Tax=Schaalia suimastitidis TaxID=121163 RepID=UPI0003F8BD56|nr:LacI family DNA-binding transcriptional regulator [Schaalia suimastitidis]
MNIKKPTSHDVARLAGVSQTTVSYVMSGRRVVAPETENRVLRAMEELGYQPHSGARALRSSRSNVLGVVVPYHAGADPAAQHHFLVSLASVARESDYDILLLTADEGAAGLRRVIDTALCDGLFIMEVLADDPRARVLVESQTPAVFIGIPGDIQGVIAIDADYAQAAAQAIEHLANRGHHTVTFLVPGHQSLANLNFIERFRQSTHRRARELGVQLNEYPVSVSYEHILRHLHDIDPRSGDALLLAPIVPADDWCNALRSRGLVPGQDVSLIASSWDAQHSHTVDHPSHFDMRTDQLTKQAMRLLLDRINSQPPRQALHQLIEPTFVPGSTLMPKRY